MQISYGAGRCLWHENGAILVVLRQASGYNSLLLTLLLLPTIFFCRKVQPSQMFSVGLQKIVRAPRHYLFGVYLSLEAVCLRNHSLTSDRQIGLPHADPRQSHPFLYISIYFSFSSVAIWNTSTATTLVTQCPTCPHR